MNSAVKKAKDILQKKKGRNESMLKQSTMPHGSEDNHSDINTSALELKEFLEIETLAKVIRDVPDWQKIMAKDRYGKIASKKNFRTSYPQLNFEGIGTETPELFDSDIRHDMQSMQLESFRDKSELKPTTGLLNSGKKSYSSKNVRYGHTTEPAVRFRDHIGQSFKDQSKQVSVIVSLKSNLKQSMFSMENRHKEALKMDPSLFKSV